MLGRFTRILSLAVLFAASGAEGALPAAADDDRPDAGRVLRGRVLRDISYTGERAETAYEKERCKLDLYLPAKPAGCATLLWFHGGGLRGGDKAGEMAVRIAQRFARDGVAVAAVNYRLHPKVTFPAYVEDAASAFRWIRQNIAKHGGSPAKIFISGHSAGGYLTAMLGLDPRYLRRHGLGTEAIAGLIPVSGQMVTHSTVRAERGIPPTTPVIDAAAPSYHVRPGTPPFLNICGGEDLPARAAENIYFVAAMKAAGNERVRYLEVAGRDHGTIASRIPEASDVVAAAILKFVAAHATRRAERASRPEVEGSRRSNAPGRRILAADASRRRIAIVGPTGAVEWEREIGQLHDLHLLPGGHVLFQSGWTRIVEVDPGTDKVVWTYDAARMNGNAGKRVEVHAFQRLPNGLTMIAESGPGRIIEVDRDGRIVHQVEMKIPRPDPHRDTRLVRKLESGNYLVSHEGMGVVREYDRRGKVVWEFEVPLFGKKRRRGHGPEGFGNAVFCALRLASGNTLISTGNGHGVLEVTPGKEVVWELQQDDLPEIQLAWVTTLQVLPDGHIVLGNCHAGPSNPQIVEITGAKEVVWTYRDFELFGNALSNSQVLGGEGRGLR
ncbi:MAG: alpha/beta hydrolase fold domain-containing protein [Planctomycetota bacterium]|nr:alpha/beta hydrolase fold domain-containing protein [Planctomycetota bacterium]